LSEGKYLRSRFKRDACSEEMDRRIPLCTERIENKLTAAIEAGPDGKPDWKTRIMCNFVTDYIDGCIGEFEGTVCDDGDIQLLKDFNMPTLVTDEVLESWDVDSSFYEKCPVVKEHKERMKDKAYQEKLNVWIDKLAGVEEEKKGVDDVATFEVDAGAEAQANIGILTIPSLTYFVITLIVVYISSF